MDSEKLVLLKQLNAGSVAVPGDPLYAKASKMFTRTIKPGAVVQPGSREDVAKIVRFIREHALPFAIRSGGHNAVADRLADGILLIDMSGLASVEVIGADTGVVRVGAGALWHEVASTLEPYNLGISAGDTRTVGVGGLATGGGIGWMMRKYGPLVDNTLAVDVVTADGAVVEASKEENADLFWAIRGGGSNFGIVTHFVFQAHKIEGIIDDTIIYPLQDAGCIIKGWRDAMRTAPPELTTMLTVLPAMGDIPASVMIRSCFAGTDKKAAGDAVAPFLALGTPTSHQAIAKPYGGILEDAALPPDVRVITNNVFMQEFTDEVIEAIAVLCRQTPPILQIRHIAGVMSERPSDDTAFAYRDAEVLIVSPVFVTPDASPQEIEAALVPWRTIERFGKGVYLNLLSEDTGKEISEAFPPATLERLRKIKARYDPENMFRSSYTI